jgi:isopenicillin-N epimerase
MREHWTLDPGVTFLNHGSFGACPRVVLEVQAELRARLEREPVQFFLHQLEPLLDEARAALAAFLRVDPADLVFVTNATTGVSTVLRSLDLAAGDELLTTDHAYNACRNAVEALAEERGARVVVAPVPFPSRGADEIVEAVLARAGERTRLALLDHVASPTALVFPLERLVPALQQRGIDVLVDGAHAPGMLELDVGALGAAWYTGNCHKWLCAPKGVGFLHARRDRRDRLRPLVTSHGRNAARGARSRFHLEFDWTGTDDPTPALCLPAVLAFLASLFPGGMPALRARNHAAAVEARRILCDALGLAPPCPDDLIGSMASLPVAGDEALQGVLFDRFRIEVPVQPWPAPPRRLLRVSMHAHNEPSQARVLADALAVLRCAPGA